MKTRPLNKDGAQASVEAKLIKLSSHTPEELHPISPFTAGELKWMTKILVERGYDLERQSEEIKDALAMGMFRVKVILDDDAKVAGVQVFDHKNSEGEDRWINFEQFDPERFKLFINKGDPIEGDKSWGVHRILGSERFRKLVTDSYKISLKLRYPERIRGYPGTEGRIFQQTVADVFLATLDPNAENGEFLARRLNQRIRELGRRIAWDDPQILDTVNSNFKDVPEPSSDFKMRRLPLRSPIKVWRFLSKELPKV